MSTTSAKFSSDGNYAAYISPSGTLKIWDAKNSVLKHEYTPSSHLSASYTSLAWCNLDGGHCGKRRKRSGDEAARLMLIALGTSTGDILLYSLSRCDLHTQLTGGHSGAVNCICWSSDGETIYTCSDDQHIVEWDVRASRSRNKWKGDKTGIHCIALCHTEKHLLTAGRTIKLWDLEKRTVIQTFIGHATEIFALLPVTTGKEFHDDEQKNNNNNVDGSYFLSAAREDRIVNAWKYSSSSKMKKALASLALDGEAQQVSMIPPSQTGQNLLLSAVTKSGQVLVFEHQLNGPCAAAVEASARLQVVSSGGANEAPQRIPVLCATLTSDRQLHFAYGNFLTPSFETITHEKLERETTLIRDNSTQKSSVQLETAISKVKTPVTSAEVTRLAPGQMVTNRAQPQRSTKDKRKRLASVDMSMEERLNAISMEKPATAGKVLPKTDSLATLLAQGLHSKDVKILDSVLNRGDVRLIRSTVRMLPLPVVVPLVHELTARITRHAQTARTCLKWVRVVLTTHTSYLMSFPELVDSLCTLYQLMESRCQTFSRLARLQGKLDLMLSQVSTQEETEGEVDTQQPLLVYRDGSSDDELGVEDVMHMHSESEDNWEELSDMEADTEPTPAVKRSRDQTDSEHSDDGGQNGGQPDSPGADSAGSDSAESDSGGEED